MQNSIQYFGKIVMFVFNYLGGNYMKKRAISEATSRNWEKLDVDVLNKKLVKRANKRESDKNILPKEYFVNIKNIQLVEEIIITWKKSNLSIHSFMINLCFILFKENDLINEKYESKNKYIRQFIEEYKNEVNDEISVLFVPKDERDILGLIYQSLKLEGEKNILGSYYTPEYVVEDLLSDVKGYCDKTILDPCCGTGSFLLNLNDFNPKNIYGYDIDETAVLIAKVNLLIKFKEEEFKPNIYYLDYLNSNENLFSLETSSMKFDYIITNPPWGSMTKDYSDNFPCIKSDESFSYFLVMAIKSLNVDGVVKFLLPESILNVKKHKDIRKFILDNTSIEKITLYPNIFNGVLTKVVSIELKNSLKNKSVAIVKNGIETKVDINIFMQNENNVFSIISDFDSIILNKINSPDHFYLDRSEWALGIVTGDNKGKLFNQIKENFEPIYTGKEVDKFILKKATKYIKFDKEKLQQVAPERFYRAKEKIVYKFISKNLVFAYDNTGSLCLNSANILIPDTRYLSVKCIVAFLNSDVIQFFYSKKFNELKVLRGNLLKIPLPKLDNKSQDKVSSYVDSILLGNRNNIEELNNYLFNFYKFDENEIKYIKGEIYGSSNKRVK